MMRAVTGMRTLDGGATVIPATWMCGSGEVAVVDVEVAVVDEVDVLGVDPAEAEADAYPAFASSVLLASRARTCFVVRAPHHASRLAMK